METDSRLISEAKVSHHLPRRIAAVLCGGLGVFLLCLGLGSSVLIGFVSSPEAVKKTTIHVVEQPEVQDYLVDKIVKDIEDKANVVEKIVLILAHNKIDSALHKVFADPEIHSFAGDAAAKAYSVYVNDEPTAEIDISPISKAVVAAVIGTDKRLRFANNLELDPIKVTRSKNDFDYGALRDSIQMGTWLFIALGLLLQVAAWFLAVADSAKKVQRLGIRVAVFGAIFIEGVSVLRNQIPGMAGDNKVIATSLVDLATSPVVTRFIILTLLGVATASIGFLLSRRHPAPQNMSI
jgi:hypothetical protein